MDWYPKRRFGDLADEIADRLPDAEGLVFEEARYTFRQVAQRINDAAKRLIAAGVGDAQAQAGTVAWPALEKTAAAASDSTLATRAGIVDPDAPTFHHVHLRYHRVSQGGGAQPQTDPQRRGAHLPDGDHAQRRDP